MAKVFAGIDSDLERFLLAQRVFFVATAPLAASGHVNLSPKGLDSFRVLDPTTVAYLDLTGSGAETVAHLRENGRIVLMFCAFEGPPRIVRLHGQGEVVAAEIHQDLFPALPGPRAVIVIRLDRVSDSCGYGVPQLKFAGVRPQMAAWAESKERSSGLAQYRLENNQVSIDGLPALDLNPFL